MKPNYFNNPISKRFIDAFPKFKADEGEEVNYFWEAWQQSPFFKSTTDFTEEDLKEIYNHLMANYYNWHFIYLDDLGITLNVFHIIEEYYPNVKERLNLAEQIRNLSLEEFEKSGISINSQGANPKIATEMDALIDLVDNQTANFQLKSKEQTLRAKFMSLYDGIMDEFIERFRPLFVKLYTGVNSYIYRNPDPDVDEDEEE